MISIRYTCIYQYHTYHSNISDAATLKELCNMRVNVLFLNKDFIRKSIKITILTKYIGLHICTSHHQPHIQILHIIQNEVLTMDKKFFIKIDRYRGK